MQEGISGELVNAVSPRISDFWEFSNRSLLLSGVALLTCCGRSVVGCLVTLPGPQSHRSSHTVKSRPPLSGLWGTESAQFVALTVVKKGGEICEEKFEWKILAHMSSLMVNSVQMWQEATISTAHRPRACAANSRQICTYVIRITNEDTAAAQKWHGDLANRNLHHHLEFFNHQKS